MSISTKTIINGVIVAVIAAGVITLGKRYLQGRKAPSIAANGEPFGTGDGLVPSVPSEEGIFV